MILSRLTRAYVTDQYISGTHLPLASQDVRMHAQFFSKYVLPVAWFE